MRSVRVTAMLREFTRRFVSARFRRWMTLTHEGVSEVIGTTRETVSPLFSEFKKKQLMQLKGATLVILSRTALEKIVQW